MAREVWKRVTVALGSAVLAGAVGSLPAQAASPVFSGYAWPEHAEWFYHEAMKQTMAVRVVAPSSLLASGGGVSPAAATRSETFRIAVRLDAPVSIRTGAVKEGGLYVQMTVASAPLTVTLVGPGIGTRAQTVSAPTLTISGRLAANGTWIPITATAQGGNLPGGAVDVKSLVKAGMLSQGSLVPPVPQSGFQAGHAFHHEIVSSPDSLLSAVLSGLGPARTVKTGTWALSSVNTPSLNVKGNWVIASRISTPKPLTASFTMALPGAGKGRVTMTATTTGQIRTVLDAQEGGRLLRSMQNTAVTGNEVDTFAGPQGSGKTVTLRESIHGHVSDALLPVSGTSTGSQPSA